ncbi:transposase [Escherichia coli]|nr:transposase [Escherichia coli]
MDKPTDWRSGTRRIFSNEFKLHMVELASKPNANVAQLAREHGVDNNLIFKWLRLWQREGRISRRMPPTIVGPTVSQSFPASPRPRNVIVHTDRGGQYCSADYQAQLKRHNLRGSMSAKGCCYDNACVESFFHSLKVECIHGEHFISREIMRATVFNYIECDYNRWRRHSWCGGLSPEQFENKNLA